MGNRKADAWQGETYRDSAGAGAGDPILTEEAARNWIAKFNALADEGLRETSHLVAMGHPRRAEALHRADAFREAGKIIDADLLLACTGSLPAVDWGGHSTTTGGTSADGKGQRAEQQVDVDFLHDGFRRIDHHFTD